MNKPTEQVNETIILFFRKIDKTDKPLARLIKTKGEDSNQLN